MKGDATMYMAVGFVTALFLMSRLTFLRPKGTVASSASSTKEYIGERVS